MSQFATIFSAKLLCSSTVMDKTKKSAEMNSETTLLIV